MAKKLKLAAGPGDPPEYPGINVRTSQIKQQYPWLSKAQAWVMAAVEIAPERNDFAEHIGWDGKNRPLFRVEKYGGVRYSAQLKNGDPGDPVAPFDLMPHIQREGLTIGNRR
jgi:hypothetical protein